MKLLQYVSAYIALLTLTKKEMPYAASYELVKLKQRIFPKVEYYTEEEKKLVNRFAQTDESGRPTIRNGSFTCKGDGERERAANTAEYERLRGDLGNVEDGDAIIKPVIRLPEDIRVSPEVLEALEPFVTFTRDEG